jgi:hypothetical protein
MVTPRSSVGRGGSPSDRDPGQEDSDGDGIGDACNDPVDGDGWGSSKHVALKITPEGAVTEIIDASGAVTEMLVSVA